jgi:hypothetical protein
MSDLFPADSERPAATQSPVEAALRDFLAQPWNDADVLSGYQTSDQIRAGRRRIDAIRKAAITPSESTWARLAEAAHLETEIHRVEMVLDEAVQ